MKKVVLDYSGIFYEYLIPFLGIIFLKYFNYFSFHYLVRA
jgi:hypothetical protein